MRKVSEVLMLKAQKYALGCLFVSSFSSIGDSGIPFEKALFPYIVQYNFHFTTYLDVFHTLIHFSFKLGCIRRFIFQKGTLRTLNTALTLVSLFLLSRCKFKVCIINEFKKSGENSENIER